MVAIVALIVFVLGGYLFMRRATKREVPRDVQELGSRVGRSIHAAIPIRGIGGQSSADFAPQGPQVDDIGSEEHHIMMVDARGRPIVEEPAPPEVWTPPAETPSPVETPPPKRRRRRRPAE